MSNFYKSDTAHLKYLYSCPSMRDLNPEDLVELVKNVLGTDIDLDFLLELRKQELEILAACIERKINQRGNLF